MAKKVEVDPRVVLAVPPSEAAARISMGVDSIKILMQLGELPFMRGGRGCLIWIDDLMALKEKLRYKEIDYKNKKLVDIDYQDTAI